MWLGAQRTVTNSWAVLRVKPQPHGEPPGCLCGVSEPDSFGNRDLLVHSDCPFHAASSLPMGGYCLSGCRVAFASESVADAHTAMTGHATGYPLEDIDWPVATDEQVMGRGG